MITCITAIRIVATAPTTYIPAPIASPIPAVAQIPAAVVRPRIEEPFRKMIPAPRNETPLTTCAAIRAGSVPLISLIDLPSSELISAKPYFEMIIIRLAAQHTMIWVRMPASLKRLLLSKPMIAPHTQPITNLRTNSRYCKAEN